MGGAESAQQGQETPKIRSSSSYYGQNTDLGDIDSGNIEETIRDLQLERLYKRNPDLRPKEQSSEPSYQLKTVLSISDPPPFLKVFDNFSLISFGLKSEAPGRIMNYPHLSLINVIEHQFRFLYLLKKTFLLISHQILQSLKSLFRSLTFQLSSMK